VNSMKKLFFGTAGIPLSTKKRNTVEGIKKVNKLGLEAMELEFVHSVHIKKDKAPEVKKTAEDSNVILTCHAPYYMNLNAQEEKKLNVSKGYIINSAKIANLCGAWSLCFHAAYYMKQDKKKVYELVKKRLKLIVRHLKDESNNIWIRPELTGKKIQFGSLDELLRLSQDIEGVMPCIDFSHMHARTQKYNTKQEFEEIMQEVEKALGRHGLSNMHIHVSGINYTEKGEKNHLTLKQSDMNYNDLLKILKKFKARGVVICESPNIEKDALLMQKTYKNL